MNKVIYLIKAYALLAKRVMQRRYLPFHSKSMTVSEAILPENRKYHHNGIVRTVQAINAGKCRLQWLRD